MHSLSKEESSYEDRTRSLTRSLVMCVEKPSASLRSWADPLLGCFSSLPLYVLTVTLNRIRKLPHILVLCKSILLNNPKNHLMCQLRICKVIFSYYVSILFSYLVKLDLHKSLIGDIK